MERLQGPINSCRTISLDLGCLDQVFINTESLRFGEEEPQHFQVHVLKTNCLFFKMLHTVETPPFFPYKEPSFQTLLKLQHLQKPWNMNTFYMPETDTQVQPLELESCVTHDIVDLHSPVKSETKEHPIPHSNSCLEGVSPEPAEPNSDSSIPWRAQPQTVPDITTHFSGILYNNNHQRKKKEKTNKGNQEQRGSRRANA
ncbi:hypothetical protein NC652_032081 [Populus alba x Populus x berolinensis]|nr:hypothetical protein NC652_032081 [Populus alba x Populus x berolinensis]